MSYSVSKIRFFSGIAVFASLSAGCRSAESSALKGTNVSAGTYVSKGQSEQIGETTRTMANNSLRVVIPVNGAPEISIGNIVMKEGRSEVQVTGFRAGYVRVLDGRELAMNFVMTTDGSTSPNCLLNGQLHLVFPSSGNDGYADVDYDARSGAFCFGDFSPIRISRESFKMIKTEGGTGANFPTEGTWSDGQGGLISISKGGAMTANYKGLLGCYGICPAAEKTSLTLTSRGDGRWAATGSFAQEFWSSRAGTQGMLMSCSYETKLELAFSLDFKSMTVSYTYPSERYLRAGDYVDTCAGTSPKTHTLQFNK